MDLDQDKHESKMHKIFRPITCLFKKIFHQTEKFDDTISEPNKEKTTNDVNTTTKQDQETPQIEVPELQFSDIQNKTNNFDKNFLIRKGSHAQIYNLELGDKQIVVKKFEKPSNHFNETEFLKQVAIASRLKHEHFVELLGYYVNEEAQGLASWDQTRVCLLAYEFAQVGSLHDILHGERGVEGSTPKIMLTWLQRVRIALDSAKGLEYLHEKVNPCITHKDIRSSSILLFDDFRAKINDYNISNQAPEMDAFLNSTLPLGTFGYDAPEYAVNGLVSVQSDVYSFGVVLLELLTGRKPNDTTLPHDQRSLVRWATPLLEKNAINDNIELCVDPTLNDQYPTRSAIKLGTIATYCLQYEPDHRPPISKVVRALEALVASNASN